MISPRQKEITKQSIQQYKVVSSWIQLRQWHRKWTPSVDDQLFKQFMKSYAGDAYMLNKQGRLLPSHNFMLSECRKNDQSQ